MTTYFYRMYVCFPPNFVSLFYLFINIIPKLWTFGSHTLCNFLSTLLFFAVCYWSAIVLCSLPFAIVLHRTTFFTSVLHFSFQCSHYVLCVLIIITCSHPQSWLMLYQTRVISSVPTLPSLGMVVVVVTNMISRWKRMAVISIPALCALCQLLYVNII